MEHSITYCGSVCAECPAFLATRTDDDEIRTNTAKMWSKQYNADIKPGDINCQGCKSDGGVNFFYCNVCEIRKCGQEKGLENCAHCDEYACEKLGKFFEIAPAGRITLDEIRKELQ